MLPFGIHEKTRGSWVHYAIRVSSQNGNYFLHHFLEESQEALWKDNIREVRGRGKVTKISIPFSMRESSFFVERRTGWHMDIHYAPHGLIPRADFTNASQFLSHFISFQLILYEDSFHGLSTQFCLIPCNMRTLAKLNSLRSMIPCQQFHRIGSGQADTAHGNENPFGPLSLWQADMFDRPRSGYFPPV